jgi:hypothetical protein
MVKKRLTTVVLLLSLAFSSYLLHEVKNEKITNLTLKTELDVKQEKILNLTNEVVTTKDSITNLTEVVEQYKATLSSRVYYESLIIKKAKIRSRRSLYNLNDDIFFTMVGECEKYKIPYEIYFRLIDMESGFKFVENKSSGAYGYMQVMPRTFTYVGKQIDVKGGHTETNNILVGSYLLKKNYNKWKRRGFDDNQSWRFALAAYNAGEGKLQIKRNDKVVGWREPSYTNGYVNYIMKHYNS